jgi:hypothetical protein
MVSNLVAWPFMANFSCETARNCMNANNRGWRYTFFTLAREPPKVPPTDFNETSSVDTT